MNVQRPELRHRKGIPWMLNVGRGLLDVLQVVAILLPFSTLWVSCIEPTEVSGGIP